MTQTHAGEAIAKKRHTAKPPPATTSHTNTVYSIYTYRTKTNQAGETAPGM
jgi:hypothetical protein